MLEVFALVVYNLTMNKFFFDQMTLDHVLAMRTWGANENPLLKSYDFWPRTPEECMYWHHEKTKHDYNEYYVYCLGDQVICYLSIKNIDRQEGTARLGLVMDPNFQGQGYGFEIMKDFLEKYFSWGFKKMDLTVAAFNQRAINLYKKLGFKYIKRSYSFFDGKRADIASDMKKYFIFLPGLTICKNYLMEIGGDGCEIYRS